MGEEIGPDAEIVSVPDRLPAWSPREEWTALEEKARNEGTILFRAEGYEELIEGTRGLVAEYPELPAPVREVADGLLAYDRNCREGDAGAAEFLGFLDLHFARRTETRSTIWRPSGTRFLRVCRSDSPQNPPCPTVRSDHHRD